MGGFNLMEIEVSKYGSEQREDSIIKATEIFHLNDEEK